MAGCVEGRVSERGSEAFQGSGLDQSRGASGPTDIALLSDSI